MTVRQPRPRWWITGALSATLVVGAPVALARGAGTTEHAAPVPTPARAQSVVVFVGDGMSDQQRNAIQLATRGLSGRQPINDFPVSGLASTHSADPKQLVTDSAAAATAMANGIKTDNGAVGVDVDGGPVESVLEDARRSGRTTGIVTTSLVTDATPAAFGGAHVADRDQHSMIARQFLEHSKPDVILGGGEDYWYPPDDPGALPDHPAEDPSEGSSGTEGDLVARARQLGYSYVTSSGELRTADGTKLLGLFANQDMYQYGNGNASYDPRVSLPMMTRKALSVLDDDPNGFFLMVEQEATDSMSHVNNGKLMLEAGRALNDAVRVAQRYASSHPRTLLLVTGDHETGGLSVESAAPKDDGTDPSEDGPFPIAGSDKSFVMDWTTHGHTNADVPVTAGGPGSRLLNGYYPNTHIHDALARSLGSSPGSASGASASHDSPAGPTPDR